jgi:hypothetical protein
MKKSRAPERISVMVDYDKNGKLKITNKWYPGRKGMKEDIEYVLAGSAWRKTIKELRAWVDIMTCLGGDLIHKEELLTKLKEMER